ncbi:MAG TPA: hypothetical protein VK776_00850 [Bryobacteraceae bacterium]|nr:hypothetical protein [Bryobacteraceae bacterium]
MRARNRIDGVEVLAYVAAFDRPLHECANRFPDLRVGSFEDFLRISDQRIQGRRDDLLRGDVVNKQQHPGSQRFDRRESLSEFPPLRG